jgi:5-methyltetrahydrofolate--homocysteine methyltransferase
MKQSSRIRTACGLSIISFGLPTRKFLNHTFMVMAIAKRPGGAIVNPLDKKMMASIMTAEDMVGRDNRCMNYLKAYRAEMFEP